MRRNYRRLLFISVFAAGLMCGCASTEQKTDHHSRCGEILADSFCRNQPQKFIVPLADSAKKEFGEKEFNASREKVCRQLGEPVEKTFAGKLQHPFFHIDLWKITFGRPDSNGKNIRQDALFQVVYTTENGREKVVSFGFL